MKDLSIIIVNWKVKDLLKKCLNSILRYSDNLSIDIYIIDNNSEDGSVEMIKKDYPQIKLFALKDNQGFAKANNRALKEVNSKYILLLNPDTELQRGSLSKIINYLDQHTDIGILGPQILNSDGSKQESIRRFPTLFSQVLILLKLKNILGNIFLKKYLAKDFDYDKTENVDQVMGAAFFITNTALEKIGLLDEGFFIWFEEVDYCQRAKENNFVIKYYAEANIIHKGGSSFEQQLALKNQRIFNKSLLYYFKKHKPYYQYLILLSLIPLNLFLTYLYATFFKKK